MICLEKLHLFVMLLLSLRLRKMIDTTYIALSRLLHLGVHAVCMDVGDLLLQPGQEIIQTNSRVSEKKKSELLDVLL